MRFIDILGGFSVPISNEEQRLIEKIRKSSESKLNEREQELARLMVSRGIIVQHVEESKVKYTVNDPQAIWRM